MFTYQGARSFFLEKKNNCQVCDVYAPIFAAIQEKLNEHAEEMRMIPQPDRLVVKAVSLDFNRFYISR